MNGARGTWGTGAQARARCTAKTAALIEERTVEPTLGGSAVRCPPSPPYGVRPCGSLAVPMSTASACAHARSVILNKTPSDPPHRSTLFERRANATVLSVSGSPSHRCCILLSEGGKGASATGAPAHSARPWPFFEFGFWTEWCNHEPRLRARGVRSSWSEGN